MFARFFRKKQPKARLVVGSLFTPYLDPASTRPSRDEYNEFDVTQKLKFWINLPRGSGLPPSWNDINRWDDFVREVCSEALSEIEQLRARK